MKALLKALEKVNGVTFAVEKIILIAAVISMVAINFFQVVFRYVLHASIPWSEQTSVVLFMFMILIGGNIAIKDDSEIKIEIIKFKNPRKDNAFRLISDIVALVTLAALFLSAVLITKQGIELPRVLSSIPLKYYQLYIIMVVGFGLMFIEKLTNTIKKIIYLTDDKEGTVQ
ncbi:MAG: TRAP transporter small permease subunit [Lachnospiraceae bacterium]|nr:TRAP transporter small permease subunit [Lachnospiraceae bacterium]